MISCSAPAHLVTALIYKLLAGLYTLKSEQKPCFLLDFTTVRGISQISIHFKPDLCWSKPPQGLFWFASVDFFFNPSFYWFLHICITFPCPQEWCTVSIYNFLHGPWDPFEWHLSFQITFLCSINILYLIFTFCQNQMSFIPHVCRQQ